MVAAGTSDFASRHNSSSFLEWEPVRERALSPGDGTAASERNLAISLCHVSQSQL